jgi:hypothetical protein
LPRRRRSQDRLRGLVRVGERRWDLVLDRDQRILLPETGALQALERVLALHAAQDLCRAISSASICAIPTRPTLRLTAGRDGSFAASARSPPEPPYPMTDLYQTQRAMRNLRRIAMQRGVIAVLDIGSFKVACADPEVRRPLDARRRRAWGAMAGQARFRVIGAATTRSRGVRFGEIAAMAETERAVRTALQSAQKMAQIRVDHAIVCLRRGRAALLRAGRRRSRWRPAGQRADIARVLAACELPDLGQGREVLHAQPVNFALDHRSGLADPRGQVGRG